MPKSFLSSIRAEFDKNSVNLGNKFTVEFSGGPWEEIPASKREAIQHRVKTFELPTVNIPTVDHMVFGGGISRKVPYGDVNLGNQNTVNVVFVLDDVLSQRLLINRILQDSIGLDGQLRYADEYTFTTTVKAYEKNLSAWLEYKINECFFSSVEQTSLTVDGSAPLEISCVLNFANYQVTPYEEKNGAPVSPEAAALNALKGGVEDGVAAVKDKIGINKISF